MTMPLPPLAASGEGPVSGPLPGLVTASMVTSDGVRLDADIWLPPGEGDAPVLLMRQAYGRRLGSALCYAHPAWYARHGFMVVVQDVRGRGTSEGQFTAFVDEARDGYEAIEWAAALPRSNGRVGLYGFSYQGTNQLLAATLAPPSLCAMAPAMIGWDLYTDWASEDGALRLASNVGWGIQMAAGTAEHLGDGAAWEELFAASRAVPLNASVNARPPVLERWRALGHYHDWMERDADDPYWARISPSAALPALHESAVPALFIGGWFDTHLPGTLAAFDALRSDGEAALLVGPWTHFPWDRHVGEQDFGPAAITPVDHVQLRWFRRWLMDDGEAGTVPPIALFDIGACRWRERRDWPAGAMTFDLVGTGLASIDVESGTLAETSPCRHPGEGRDPEWLDAARTTLDPGLRRDDDNESAVAHSEATGPAIDYIVHDPWRPAPSVGGAFGTPPGPVDRARVDNRADVLVFTGAPLDAPLSLFGDVSLDLAVVSDGPAFDLACTLSRVDAGGRVIQLAEGYRSLLDHKPGERVAVSLRRTCATLLPGERLRLSIAAASFPAYPVNPGDGRRPVDTPRREARLITLGVVTGGEAGSQLRLVVEREEDIENNA